MVQKKKKKDINRYRARTIKQILAKCNTISECEEGYRGVPCTILSTFLVNMRLYQK